ncbi:periplasmic heavy metal sensor [Roseovarius sp. A21]|uniref:Periplasmic heavy metal sensor n=2 Tax=Roseovarius bejariae TaxID=2576383 RepID=A0A844D0C9_9RHOB|nr:periplasmic heavy metal sensor [Roseovarius bejariae]
MGERMEKKAGMRPWLKVVFALSLALNLLVLGVVGGVALRHGGFDGRHHHMAGGPMTRALSQEDKRVVAREMRRNYREQGRDGRAAYGAAMQQLVEGLRAEPFDPAPVATQMARMREMLGRRVAIGQQVLLEHLAQMEPEARHAFAGRLEEAMKRRWKDRE